MKIKTYRSIRKLTQKQLADIVGVSQVTISKWERQEKHVGEIMTSPIKQHNSPVLKFPKNEKKRVLKFHKFIGMNGQKLVIIEDYGAIKEKDKFPRQYLEMNGAKIWREGKGAYAEKGGKKYILNEAMDEETYKICKSIIKEAGERLKKINQELERKAKEWNGEETVQF